MATKQTLATEDTIEMMNLLQRLAAIRDMADAAKKNKKGFGYQYTDLTEILPVVRAGMKKYGVSLIPMLKEPTTEQTVIRTVTTDKTGAPVEKVAVEYITKFLMDYVWVVDATGEQIAIPWYGVGSQADPSQGFGTALTYSERYFLIDFFQIPTTEGDPEQLREKAKEAEKAEDTELAKNIIAELHPVVVEFVTAYPDQREKVDKIIGKYIKSCNYNKITDPATASKLFAEFKEFVEKFNAKAKEAK